MGNAGSQPKNKTGRKVVAKKLENANKTNILSLTQHGLEEIPPQVFQIKGLKTLDISQNKLTRLGDQLCILRELKSLNLDQNDLIAGTLDPISKLSKLQTLSAGGNKLGAPVPKNPNQPHQPAPTALPVLPTSLKQLKLDGNAFSSVPPPIVRANWLVKLEKLDLSQNNLASVPSEICHLVALTELLLDHNVIVGLPVTIGQLHKLKTLSLKSNQLRGDSTKFTEQNPQPLPAVLFSDTLLIDLNLHDNPMTSTQLNKFEGYPAFLERREKVKSKDIYGGALTNLDVCGLK